MGEKISREETPQELAKRLMDEGNEEEARQVLKNAARIEEDQEHHG